MGSGIFSRSLWRRVSVQEPNTYLNVTYYQFPVNCLTSRQEQALGLPNIEFSCPAASTKHSMELRGCIHPSRRPLRGQLQRFVIRQSDHQSASSKSLNETESWLVARILSITFLKLLQTVQRNAAESTRYFEATARSVDSILVGISDGESSYP